MPKWRTIQPAHESDRITVKQAMELWRKVEAGTMNAVRRPRSVSKPAKALSKTDSSARAKVAADHHDAGSRT